LNVKELKIDYNEDRLHLVLKEKMPAERIRQLIHIQSSKNLQGIYLD
jgi:hypothetical protein